jgi:predicted cupin superfamily sugar epimerase
MGQDKRIAVRRRCCHAFFTPSLSKVISVIDRIDRPILNTLASLWEAVLSMTKDAVYWIQKLGLEPHPEGGYYRQTYRSDLVLARENLPPQYTGPRPASTSIYFLLRGNDFSAFHRLRSDELWHFYLGEALVVHVIEGDGQYSEIQLGNDAEADEVLQAVVTAGCWFASRIRKGKSFALVGCTVSPGFDFDDFELAKREELARRYPQHREAIDKLTRT